MRRSFSLAYAILIVVLISTVMVLSLQFSAKTVFVSSKENIKIQLKLYMDSAIEYTLLWMSKDKTRSQQDQNLSISYDDNNYTIYIQIHSIKDPLPKETNGSVIVDVVGVKPNTNIRLTKRISLKP